MLSFYNDGEIDLRLVQVFGASIKETENPIGQFGTGLKHAIAVVLRDGGQVQLWSGTSGYQFSTSAATIRGSEVEVVTMTPIDGGDPVLMPFTTGCGAHWEPWMAYREFYANALDEGGGVVPRDMQCATGKTVIKVWGLDSAAGSGSDFFLSGTPLFANHDVEIYEGSSTGVFYRGIRVQTRRKRGRYTYNLKTPMQLTEDRTLLYTYLAECLILKAITEAPVEIVKNVLCGGDSYWDWDSDYWQSTMEDTSSDNPFLKVATDLYKVHGSLFSTKFSTALRAADSRVHPKRLSLSPARVRMVNQAKKLLRNIDMEVKEPIEFVEAAGPGVMGKCIFDGPEPRILVCESAFQAGVHGLATVLLEEHVHATTRMRDCSRPLQEYLFNLVVSLGEIIGQESA